MLSLPDPQHPLVSVTPSELCKFDADGPWAQFVHQFYCIALKREVKGKIKYGQQTYDYDKGVMSFTAPRQVQSLDVQTLECGTGLLLMFHPDFLLKHPLANVITQYGFFSYAVHEALHLSPREEEDVIGLFKKIDQECQHIDRHTQDIVLSQIALLLTYSNRFYERQFITRKNTSSDLLIKFQSIVDAYINSDQPAEKGLLTVQHVAAALHLSPNYLSDMLRYLTGQNAQQHIQLRLIEKAKEILAISNLTVGEVAYQLGFEHPQSFSKFFKAKTNLSPLEFRTSFN